MYAITVSLRRPVWLYICHHRGTRQTQEGMTSIYTMYMPWTDHHCGKS